MDEAGRGPLAGPVVAAAVVLPERPLRCRVDDSKKLSARMRELAYEELLDRAHCSVGIVSEALIDRLNIFQASVLAMELAVLSLSLEPDLVLVDGPIRLDLLDLSCRVDSVIGGDAKYLPIAAASVVAKVTRDRIMQDYDLQYPAYGFAKHKGYPTAAHLSALSENGITPIHRKTFGICRELARRPRPVSMMCT